MPDPARSITFEDAGRNGDGRPNPDAADDAPAHVRLNGDAHHDGDEEVCPFFHEAVELIGKRWSGVIVHALLPGPRRFSEITHSIPQMSDRLLSMRLRELESEGIVERQVFDGAPVRVEYALTPKGYALEPAIGALRQWAREWLTPIESHSLNRS
jgi:DNA-binding HxlR family transcriptional regulator